MSINDSPDDKPFDPSPKKLEEARRKGDIVRSAELNTIIIYSSSTILFFICENLLFFDFYSFIVALISQADRIATPDHVRGGLIVRIELSGALLFVALLFIVPFASLLSFLILQRGVVLNADKIIPKLENISIFKNVKQKWGAKGLFEFMKSVMKVTMVVCFLAMLGYWKIELLLAAVHWQYQFTARVIFTSVFIVIFIGLTVSIPVGILDFVQKYFEHRKKNRMSHKEMTDEAKEAEGDPNLKQKRRQFAYEVADRAKMLEQVADATVIVVNPTHYAVALMWDSSRDNLPVCVAKGTDGLAIQIKSIAKENFVPIYRDPPSARLLYSALDIGSSIREKHFRIVAAAIKFSERLRSSRKRVHER